MGMRILRLPMAVTPGGGIIYLHKLYQTVITIIEDLSSQFVSGSLTAAVL